LAGRIVTADFADLLGFNFRHGFKQINTTFLPRRNEADLTAFSMPVCSRLKGFYKQAPSTLPASSTVPKGPSQILHEERLIFNHRFAQISTDLGLMWPW
jgi:hypothetical protein